MTTQPFDGQQPIQMWELEFNFGDRIRKARRVLGLTVEQLAGSLGLSKQAPELDQLAQVFAFPGGHS